MSLSASKLRAAPRNPALHNGSISKKSVLVLASTCECTTPGAHAGVTGMAIGLVVGGASLLSTGGFRK
jgi:hypothetical protein